jgi:hypothetical protein
MLYTFPGINLITFLYSYALKRFVSLFRIRINIYNSLSTVAADFFKLFHVVNNNIPSLYLNNSLSSEF